MYHLHIARVSRGKPNAAAERLHYIARIGRYSKRGDVLRMVGSVNLPVWSDGSTDLYWQTVDRAEMRINARLLFTVEVAIPRQLSKADQTSVVEKFSRLLSRLSTGRKDKTNVPVTFAIHEGTRTDDRVTGRLPNPHAHLLCSTSINDRLDRPIERWFLRANGQRPLDGGAPRSAYIGTKRWLLHVRRAWQKLANSALRRAGLPESLDHRSHHCRGLATLPSIHLGPTTSYLERQGKVTKRSKRNADIKRENEQFEESTRKYKRQQLVVEEAAKAMRVADTEALVQQHDIILDLGRNLAAHPWALNAANIAASASAILLTRNGGYPHKAIDSPESVEALRRLRNALGGEWLTLREGARVWLLHPPSDDVVLLASGVIATDSTESAFLRASGLAAQEFWLPDLCGRATSDALPILTSILNSLKVACRWEGTLRPHSSLKAKRQPPKP